MVKRLAAPLVWALLFISILCQGQENIFGRTLHKKGIYKSYNEFINNEPSISSERLDPVEKIYSVEYFKNGDSTFVYKLVIKSTDNIDIDSIWGLCDGKNVYVLRQRDLRQFYFFMVNTWDRYSIINTFEYSSIVNAAGSVASNGLAGAIVYGLKTRRKNDIYLFNLNNGRPFQLNEKTILTILESDPPLIREYQKNKHRKDREIMLEYLLRFNEIYRGDIKVKLRQ